MGVTLKIFLNSCAVIQNNTLIENNVSWTVYGLLKSSTVQLNRVAFIRNMLGSWLQWILLNSSAIIQSCILLENYYPLVLFRVEVSSTIQLNHVAFI